MGHPVHMVTKHETTLRCSYREAEALHMEEEDDLDEDDGGRNGQRGHARGHAAQSSSLSSILQSG